MIRKLPLLLLLSCCLFALFLSSGGASSGAEASSDATPLPAGFEAFYVAADGSEPTFQSYAAELTARYLQALHKWANLRTEHPYLWMVSAPGWNRESLSKACLDPNTVGGLLITYSSYTTRGYWLLVKTEVLHVTPVLTYISCVGGKARVVTPAITLHTDRSKERVTIPVGPLAGVATLFMSTAKTTTTTSTTNVGNTTETTTTTSNGSNAAWSVIPLGIASSLTGDVGETDPGMEALGVAKSVALDAAVVTRILCSIPSPGADVLMADGRRMSTVMEDAQRMLDPNEDLGRRMTDGMMPSNYRQAMYPSLREVRYMLELERSTYLKLPSVAEASPSPTPTPSLAVTFSGPSGALIGVAVRARIVPRASALPNPTTTLPLAAMCKALGGDVPEMGNVTPRARS